MVIYLPSVYPRHFEDILALHGVHWPIQDQTKISHEVRRAIEKPVP